MSKNALELAQNRHEAPLSLVDTGVLTLDVLRSYFFGLLLTPSFPGRVLRCNLPEALCLECIVR